MVKKQNIKWTKLVEYINSKNIGDVITRSDIVTMNDEKGGKNTSTDEFRLYLQHCEYLEPIGMAKGQYKILRYFDTEITSTEMKKMAYNREYRINNERFKKLNIILNENDNISGRII